MPVLFETAVRGEGQLVTFLFRAATLIKLDAEKCRSRYGHMTLWIKLIINELIEIECVD